MQVARQKCNHAYRSVAAAPLKGCGSLPASKHSQPLQFACIGTLKLHERCPQISSSLHTNSIHHNAHTILHTQSITVKHHWGHSRARCMHLPALVVNRDRQCGVAATVLPKTIVLTLLGLPVLVATTGGWFRQSAHLLSPVQHCCRGSIAAAPGR